MKTKEQIERRIKKYKKEYYRLSGKEIMAGEEDKLRNKFEALKWVLK